MQPTAAFRMGGCRVRNPAEQGCGWVRARRGAKPPKRAAGFQRIPNGDFLKTRLVFFCSWCSLSVPVDNFYDFSVFSIAYMPSTVTNWAPAVTNWAVTVTNWARKIRVIHSPPILLL